MSTRLSVKSSIANYDKAVAARSSGVSSGLKNGSSKNAHGTPKISKNNVISVLQSTPANAASAKPASLPYEESTPTYSRYLDIENDGDGFEERNDGQTNGTGQGYYSDDSDLSVHARYLKGSKSTTPQKAIALSTEFQLTSTSTSSNPWDQKSADFIYEVLIAKGNRLGAFANRQLALLQSKGFIGTKEGPRLLLAKNKPDRVAQKQAFGRLPPQALRILRDQLFLNNIDTKGRNHLIHPEEEDDDDEDEVNSGVKTSKKKNATTVVLDESAVVAPGEAIHLQARICHLAKDEEPESILTAIFASGSTVVKEARREKLDAKDERSAALWAKLADSYINNREWTPVNEFEDRRLEEINPMLPPAQPIAAEKLRTIWSDLRTRYSVCYHNYHASGQGVMGEEEGDDEFCEKFTRGNLIFFYMHKLFGKYPPTFIARDLPSHVQSDVGAGSESAGRLRTTTSSSSAAGKRRRLDDDSQKPETIDLTTSEERQRDKAMEQYYRAQQQQSKLGMMTTAMESPLFNTVFDDMQRGSMKDKYKHFVMGVFDM